MQKDLIDRGALVRHLVDWQMESFSEVGHEKEYNLLDMIIRGIENEPTAYNVKQVLEEIEEYSRRVYGEISTVKVMSIVRKGGV